MTRTGVTLPLGPHVGYDDQMRVEEEIRYWIDLARYDLGVAGSLLKARKYVYALKRVRKWHRRLSAEIGS